MKPIYIRVIIAISILIGLLTLHTQLQAGNNTKKPLNKEMTVENEISKSDREWQQELTPEQYRILRQKETERPFTGKYDKFNATGTYVCAGCGNQLFDSDSKFDAGCGWPSYSQPIDSQAVAEETDNSWGMKRVEVVCSKCGGHLGHVFEDGPKPTGLRYCINSGALDFEPTKSSGTEE